MIKDYLMLRNAKSGILIIRLEDEQHEHGHGKWEGGQMGKSDKRITESKARQK
jgi:hypothetical protein